MRRILGIALKVALSIGLLVLIARRTDVAKIAGIVAGIAPATIVVVLGLALVQSLVAAYRWVLVMGSLGVDLEVWPAIQALYASLFINQCLPSYVGGDAYRVYWMYREGSPLPTAVRGVLIDRVSALMALVAMMVATLPRLFARFPDHAVETGMVLVAAGGVIGSAVFFACDASIPRSWRRVRALAELAELSAGARRVLLGGGNGVAVTALAVVGARAERPDHVRLRPTCACR